MIPTTTRLMLRVLLALIPGLAALVWFFGIGILVNVAIACITAFGVEALVLHFRGQSLIRLKDGSALLAGALLGIALPPLLPVYMVLLGTIFALVIGKHVYGGLGQNPFNPAMVGYAGLILSFPLAMSLWPNPGHGPAAIDSLAIKFGFALPIDAMSGATALDTLKFRGALTIEEIWQPRNGFGLLAGISSEWINAGFLIGGAYLLVTRTISWRAPLGMLLGLGVCALVFYDSGSSASPGSPLFHLFSGATMLGAFFIVTDPVSSPDTYLGQWLFGLGVGALTFLLRAIGAYPDGVAFAVLLMNALVPLLDMLARRRAHA